MSKVSKMVLNVTLPLIFYWDACCIVVVGGVKDVFAHNFLNIHLIFNLEKVLKSWDLELFNHTTNTVYIKACWRCWRCEYLNIMSEMLEMWNISILCTYCTLMSEMWNISIKDQRLCNYFHVKGVKDGVKYE